MRNGHQLLLCKRAISDITYEKKNRKDELRGLVTDTADTTIALHQKTYVTMMFGLVRRRMRMIKSADTADEDRIPRPYTKQT